MTKMYSSLLFMIWLNVIIYFLLLQALQAGLPQRGSVPSGMMLW